MLAEDNGTPNGDPNNTTNVVDNNNMIYSQSMMKRLMEGIDRKAELTIDRDAICFANLNWSNKDRITGHITFYSDCFIAAEPTRTENEP